MRIRMRTVPPFITLNDVERKVYHALANELRSLEQPTDSLSFKQLVTATLCGELEIAMALVRLCSCGYVTECSYADQVYKIRPLTACEKYTEHFLMKHLPDKIWVECSDHIEQATVDKIERIGGHTYVTIQRKSDGMTTKIPIPALEYCLNSNLPVVW